MGELDAIRDRIRSIDEELAELVSRRVDAAREAGRAKRDDRVAIRDYEVERGVVARFRDAFTTRELDPDLGERLAQLLIVEALRVQEQDGLTPAKGARGRALIVGGAGQMGAWFSHFMSGLGYEVVVNDPAGPLEGFAFTTDARRTAEQMDIVILSTPPAETPAVLQELEGLDCVIMDIASLKGPLAHDLKALAEHQPVVSVHPLWGPDTRVLSGKNVLVLDCGHPAAKQAALDLFNLTAANVFEMALEDHDPAMAYTLGLPHAINLAYAEALTASPFAFEELTKFGGPTFLKQTSVASEVASENPELYRQIQALNDETPAIFQAIHDATDHLAERIDDPKAFQAAMEHYHATFDDFHGGSF